MPPPSVQRSVIREMALRPIPLPTPLASRRVLKRTSSLALLLPVLLLLPPLVVLAVRLPAVVLLVLLPAVARVLLLRPDLLGLRPGLRLGLLVVPIPALPVLLATTLVPVLLPALRLPSRVAVLARLLSLVRVSLLSLLRHSLCKVKPNHG